MKSVLLVGVGGFIGASLRYAVGVWVAPLTDGWRLPGATFLVNVVGCLAAGVLMASATKQGFFSANTRLFLFFGLLGGFTTFSAFGLEAVHLIHRQAILIAVLYVAGTLAAGFAAVGIGGAAVR
jgi:CrcB protein